MKQTDPQFKLRLPEDLLQQIEAAATGNNRSMSAEIVERLRRSFDSGSDALVIARLTRDLAEMEVERLAIQMHGTGVAAAVLPVMRKLIDRETVAEEATSDALDALVELVEEGHEGMKEMTAIHARRGRARENLMLETNRVLRERGEQPAEGRPGHSLAVAMDELEKLRKRQAG